MTSNQKCAHPICLDDADGHVLNLAYPHEYLSLYCDMLERIE